MASEYKTGTHLNAEQYAFVRQKALLTGMSISAYIKRLIDQERKDIRAQNLEDKLNLLLTLQNERHQELLDQVKKLQAELDSCQIQVKRSAQTLIVIHRLISRLSGAVIWSTQGVKGLLSRLYSDSLSETLADITEAAREKEKAVSHLMQN